MKINLILPFIFLCTCAFSQSLHGKVTDTSTGEPIAGVNLNVLNTNQGTTTNEDGTFALPITLANRLIRFSGVGYLSIEQTLDSDSLFSISLQPSAIYLNNNVTITAQRFERDQFEVRESVSILNADELNQLSARSAPEALMGSTGVWIQKTNHGGGSPIIRGFMGNQILLLVDGIRMNNATYRYGPNQYLSTIDPGMIERIEATRGSGSVLYGSDALGGVVQVISKDPVFIAKTLQVSGMANGRWISRGMEKSGRGEIQISSKRVAFLGGFSYRDYGDIVAAKKIGTLVPTGYHTLSGDAKMLWKTGSNGMLTAAYQQVDQHDVDRYDQIAQGDYSVYKFEPQTRQLSYLRWETFTGNKLIGSWRTTLALHRSGEGIVSQKNNSPEQKKQYDGVDTWSFMTELHSDFNAHWRAHSGIEYYHDAVTSNAHIVNQSTGVETSQRGSYTDGANASNLAFFSNHEVDWNQFTLSTGVRYNLVKISVNDATFGNQHITPNALVGNVGITYKIHPNHHLMLAANTGFRAPNVDDLSKFGAVENTVFEIPSAKLSPEKSVGVELGLKSMTRNFSGSLALYHTSLSDLIDRMPSSWEGMDSVENRKVYQKQNVSKAELFGIEADGEWMVASSWVAFANATYTYGQNISKNEPLRRIPPLFGKLGLRYQHRSGLRIRAEWMIAGDQDRLAGGDKSDTRISVRLVDGIMPGWDIVNLYAGYQYRLINVSASWQNLFDKAYRIYASGVDASGRNISFSLTVGF